MAGPDFGINFAAAIARDSVCAAVREARYCFQFKRFVKALGEEKDNLIIRRQSVQERAKKAKEATKKTDIIVERWLDVADNLIAEAVKLEEKATTSKSYCLGSCPNWICRNCLAKKIEEKTKAMIDHNKRGEFKHFGHLLTLPGVKYYSTEGFINFNSTQVAYDQILEALKADDVNMIGLCGMGGSGKTTLAKVVGKAAVHLFDKVFLVAISTVVDVRKIQGQIASSIGLELKEEFETERAQRLWLSLINRGERILIILDDVWEKLDFEKIGIPIGESHKVCNVLLTTQRRNVCNLMGCERTIFLSPLKEEEAWTLFQKHAGLIGDIPNALKDLARDITNECKGLPVAIAALASTLKDKTLGEWKEALETLRDSRPLDVEEGERNPYTCLKLSYDNLRTEEAKLIFLLCCVFPKDYEIQVEPLTRIAIGLGLVREVQSYKRARNKVSAAISMLVDSCLLLDSDEEQCVKMHGLVRDVGLWIAKEEIKALTWPPMFGKTSKDATAKDSMIRYLWCDMVETFPNQLDFPKLEFLNVLTDLEHMVLSDDIFHGTKTLRVLVLFNHPDGMAKPMLPLSKPILSLTNLRCLVLFGWALGDISSLGSIERLEILTLRSCSFHELPNEILHLTYLRLLDLSECQSKRNPYEVIGRCSQLQELYFIGNGGEEWEDQGQDTAEFFDENSVDLGALQRYRLEIGKSFGLFDSLDFSISRGLSVQYFDASTSNATIKDLMQKAEALSLWHIRGGCKNIIPDLVQTVGGGMADLIELQLRDSDNIEYLIDNANNLCQLGTVFSKLVKLRISDMKCLEALCNHPPPSDVFEKLEEILIMGCSRLCSSLFVGKLNLCNLKALKLENCPMLTFLFTPAIAPSLVLLEILEIKNCDGLKRIVANEEGEIISVSDDRHQKSYTPLFPKLKQLVVEKCRQLESLIPVSYAHGLVHLESLQIIDDPQLKYIFGECNHENQLPSHQNKNELQIIKFPALKVLCLEDLPNISGICPENYCPMWPSLHELNFLDCPKLNILSISNSIVISEVRQLGHPIREELGQGVMDRDDELSTLQTLKNVKTLWVRNCKIQGIFQLAAGLPFDEKLDPSYLQDLYLENLGELRYISRGPTQCMRLQNLESLEVQGCGRLKFIFSTSIAKGLPQLKVLTIKYCSQLQQVIEDEELPNLLNHCMEFYEASDCPVTTSSTPLEYSPHAHQNSGSFNLCSLERLTLDSCPMLISLFTQSTAQTMTSLEDLRVENCHGLKCLIEHETRAEGIEREEFQDNHDLQNFSIFPRLKNLKVEKCDLLEYIFPISFAQGLVQLESIEISETPRLKYIFGQSDHEDGSSYQSQNRILVKLPILEELKLQNLPDLISICSKNYHATCLNLRQLSLNYVGLSIMSLSSLVVSSEVAHWDCNSAEVASHVKTLESLTVESLKIDCIFHLEGLPIDKEPVASRLVELDLLQLPELRYICKGPKNFLSLESLNSLTIVGCRKLKFIFSASILRILPLLGTLLIVNCEELEQIIEEDEENENQPNLHAHPVCFPQLTVLVVKHCNKLKRLFSFSTSLELPKLEQLIISEASQLEEVFGCEQGEAEESVEIMLPKLEHLILVELPCLASVYQGNALQSVRYRVVHNCPKLTLTQTTTLRNLLKQYQNKDNEMDDLARTNFLLLLRMVEANNNLSGITETTNEKSTPETGSYLQMGSNSEDSEVQVASESELPSSQSFSEIVQESSTSEKVNSVTSPSHSQQGSILPGPSHIYLIPQELSKDEAMSKPISVEQNETCHQPSNPQQNVEEPENHSAYKEPSKKTTTEISLAVPKSCTTSEASLGKTSDIQISSGPQIRTFSSTSLSVKTSRNLLVELSKRALFENFTARIDTSGSSMIPQPQFLEELKTELAVYLDMPLEAICEANALDNVERIVNSLAMGTTNYIEKNILEDLANRLKIFKERVPKAMSNMKSSSEFMTDYENLSVGYGTKLSEAREKVNDLHSRLSEACEEEREVEMEIQKLISRKNEIIDHKRSLLSQIDQSSQGLSEYYEEWKAVGEELKLSTEKWLKSKEDLAHANASWRIYKESLGL